MLKFKQYITKKINESNTPYRYSSADFAGPVMTVEKIGNPVTFKVSKGETVSTKEGDVTAPKGHVIITRPSVKGQQPDTYSMPREKFDELHDEIDEKAGTARQKGVRKPAIIADRNGEFKPPWADAPLSVRKGDMIVNNGGPHDPKNPHNDVAAVQGNPNDSKSVSGQTYKVVR